MGLGLISFVPFDLDTMYQRGKIQEESMYYEHKKHDGSLPLVGVNTFLPKEHAGEIATDYSVSLICGACLFQLGRCLIIQGAG